LYLMAGLRKRSHSESELDNKRYVIRYRPEPG
jgi:hypothetical protein